MNQSKSQQVLFRSTFYTCVLFVLGALVVRTLELRLPGITRNFWEDEIRHNFSVIHTTYLKWMLETLWSQYQPFLDFFLRKYFWVLPFGHNYH